MTNATQADFPYAIVARLTEAVSSGSYLVLGDLDGAGADLVGYRGVVRKPYRA